MWKNRIRVTRIWRTFRLDYHFELAHRPKSQEPVAEVNQLMGLNCEPWNRLQCSWNNAFMHLLQLGAAISSRPYVFRAILVWSFMSYPASWSSFALVNWQKTIRGREAPAHLMAWTVSLSLSQLAQMKFQARWSRINTSTVWTTWSLHVSTSVQLLGDPADYCELLYDTLSVS